MVRPRVEGDEWRPTGNSMVELRELFFIVTRLVVCTENITSSVPRSKGNRLEESNTCVREWRCWGWPRTMSAAKWYESNGAGGLVTWGNVYSVCAPMMAELEVTIGYIIITSSTRTISSGPPSTTSWFDVHIIGSLPKSARGHVSRPYLFCLTLFGSLPASLPLGLRHLVVLKEKRGGRSACVNDAASVPRLCPLLRETTLCNIILT